MPLHQKEPSKEYIPKRVHIPNKKHTKTISRQIMAAHLHGEKVQTHGDDAVSYFLLLRNRITIIIERTFFFG
jgi:hypothetical protein